MHKKYKYSFKNKKEKQSNLDAVNFYLSNKVYIYINYINV